MYILDGAGRLSRSSLAVGSRIGAGLPTTSGATLARLVKRANVPRKEQ